MLDLKGRRWENHMNTPVTILVSKDEIVSENASGVRGILDSFVPILIDRNRNRVTIMINGYDTDSPGTFSNQ